MAHSNVAWTLSQTPQRVVDCFIGGLFISLSAYVEDERVVSGFPCVFVGVSDGVSVVTVATFAVCSFCDPAALRMFALN